MPAKKKGADEAPKKKSVLELIKSIEAKSNITHVELKQRTPDDFLSTGCLSLDLILGGGFFGGRIIQFFGAPHTGKSTTGYTSAARLHEQGVFTQFFDYEGTTDKTYAMRLGMRFDNKHPLLRYYRPAHGHEGYDMMLKVLQGLDDQEGGLPQICFVIDTIAQMPTMGEMDDWDKNKRMAQRAVMHSEWMGRIKTLVSKKNAAIIAINQVRANMNPYQSPESIPGGNAWGFATDNLVRVSRSGQHVEVGADVFQKIKFKTQKNKNALPSQECELYLRLGHGIDPASDVIQFLTLTGCYTKGSKKTPVIQGLDAFAGGAKLDMEYKSSAKLEELIRDQAALGNLDGSIYAACRAMLKSGKSNEMFLAQKAKKAIEEPEKAVKKSKKVDFNQEVVEEGEESDNASILAVEEMDDMDVLEAAEAAKAATPAPVVATEDDGNAAVAKLKKKKAKG